MKPLYILVLSAFLPFSAIAEGIGPTPASEVTLDDFLWLKRPVVVFADSAEDPSFKRQMLLLEDNLDALDDRDVVIITDTDPSAKTSVRLKLRPRGFSLVLMDKDGKAIVRKPLPWNVREITRAIDKFPLARQEALERFPSGR